MADSKPTTRLQQLIQRTDRVLAVMHAPSAAACTADGNGRCRGGRRGYQRGGRGLYRAGIGEDILMYTSDYPHGESWSPKSVETVLGWDLPPTVKRKLFWDNAVKFYARYGHA